jgi:serpin B
VAALERWGLRALCAGAVLAVAGCGTGTHGAAGPVVVRAKPGRAAPVTAAERRAVADGTTAFGLDLFHRLDRSGNVAVSPSSLAELLGMVRPGARGRTAAELASVLHSPLTADRYAAAGGDLGRAETARAGQDKAVLRISDALWTQTGFKVRRPYLRTLATAYGTGVYQADFARRPEKARGQVNALVERQTDGAVRGLFPPGSMDRATRLVLTDAVYLKASWEQPFDPGRTGDAPFHGLGGSTSTVRMMEHEGTYRYASGDGWRAVELPYQGGHLAMDVLLPRSGGLAGFASSLTPARLGAVLGAMKPSAMTVDLPRFTFDSRPAVTGPLKRMGLGDLFSRDRADLSGIPASAREKLSVSGVVHKVHVAVDESGTTAAAGSGGGMVAGAAAPPALRMVMDRPFVFLVRDTVSGRPLFLGQVTAPR